MPDYSDLVLAHFSLSTIPGPTHVLIQALEPAALLFHKLVRLAVLHERALVHDDDFVEVEDSIEFVRDGDDGV